jgi:branched-chain amino acid transport system substrate-binding protein
MKRRLLTIVAVIITALFFPVACGKPAPEKDKIVIGAARPLSGPLAQIGDYAMGPIMTMWAEEVNARGGINVAGKKLPVELKVYDDTSDLGTSTRLIEKLILEDKVDFLFPNCSTAFLYASAPLANKYGYVYLGAEGGCTTITDMLPQLPYVFGILNYSDYYQIPTLAPVLVNEGVKTAAIIYINDLHGVEYYHTSLSEFMKAGIEIVMAQAIPPYSDDVELVLKAARDSGADALCAYVYPPTVMAVVGQSMAIGYNPKAMVLGPGVNFEFFKGIFGPQAVEGLIGFGAFNSKSSPEIADFIDRFVARFGLEMMDWWGGAYYWSALQCFEQAIEKAGSLDNEKVREVMATKHFETILGDTWFDMTAGGKGGGQLSKDCHPGQVGQWQNGTYEVIGPEEKATADKVVYPKPPWPSL